MNYTIVADNNRLAFLPSITARPMELEQSIYALAATLSQNYNGDYWEFARADNGAKFMYPASIKQFNCENPMNGNSCTLGNLAFGVAVTLMAYSHLSFEREELADHYHLLRDFIWADDSVLKAEHQALFDLLD